MGIFIVSTDEAEFIGVTLTCSGTVTSLLCLRCEALAVKVSDHVDAGAVFELAEEAGSEDKPPAASSGIAPKARANNNDLNSTLCVIPPSSFLDFFVYILWMLPCCTHFMNDTAPRLELIWAALTPGISPMSHNEDEPRTFKPEFGSAHTGFYPCNMRNTALQLRHARVQAQVHLKNDLETKPEPRGGLGPILRRKTVPARETHCCRRDYRTTAAPAERCC